MIVWWMYVRVYESKPTIINCLLLLLQLEMNLLALEPALLCGRTLLVNPKNKVKRKDMGVSYENIHVLKNKYRLHILHGNIEVCNGYLFYKKSFNQ